MTEESTNATPSEKASPCNWCRGGSRLDIGSGMFRDVDSDLSYGIPVCGGCGGLGVAFRNEEFAIATKEIMDLRFKYCPTDTLPPPALVVCLAALKQLIERVTTLYQKHQEQAAGSFAERIAKGTLSPAVEQLEKATQEQVAQIEQLPPPHSMPELQTALILAFKGKIEEAEAAFLGAINQYPNSSLPEHDYGVFLIMFRRDMASAESHFRISIERTPKKAIHFVQLARCLTYLDRHGEVEGILHQALDCDDADATPELQSILTELTLQKPQGHG